MVAEVENKRESPKNITIYKIINDGHKGRPKSTQEQDSLKILFGYRLREQQNPPSQIIFYANSELRTFYKFHFSAHER